MWSGIRRGLFLPDNFYFNIFIFVISFGLPMACHIGSASMFSPQRSSNDIKLATSISLDIGDTLNSFKYLRTILHILYGYLLIGRLRYVRTAT